jgi:hypothetical protein
MSHPRHDESPEAQEEACREELREKRDKKMFAVRLAAYHERLAVYESARSEGQMPVDFAPVEG